MLRFLPVVLCLAACSDDPKDGDAVTSEVTDGSSETDADLTGKSVYALDLVVDGNEVKVDRDLTGLGQYFAFGSTHIAPAVSFGMTDSIQFPRTMTNTLNFGIVVPSEEHPIQTPSTGTYPTRASPASCSCATTCCTDRRISPSCRPVDHSRKCASGHRTRSDWTKAT